MHSFKVHSYESACRKSRRLGLEQVYSLFQRLWNFQSFQLSFFLMFYFVFHFMFCSSLLNLGHFKGEDLALRLHFPDVCMNNICPLFLSSVLSSGIVTAILFNNSFVFLPFIVVVWKYWSWIIAANFHWSSSLFKVILMHIPLTQVAAVCHNHYLHNHFTLDAFCHETELNTWKHFVFSWSCNIFLKRWTMRF